MNRNSYGTEQTIPVMINGLPGNVATTMAHYALASPQFDLLPFSLTGPDIPDLEVVVKGIRIQLITPDDAPHRLPGIRAGWQPIVIDYTHPSAVNRNADLYVTHGLPFVMGTTGGNRKDLHQTVVSGAVPAVIAPNMAKQIVGLQAMFEYGANHFPGLFTGYRMRVKESHQQSKADTSGTAKAMVQYFNRLGIDFLPEEIVRERDPVVQEHEWGIPKEHLDGHGWHTYSITAADGSSFFEFTHNINGRDIYVTGTFDAVRFLHQKIRSRKTGDPLLYSMIDVLKGT